MPVVLGFVGGLGEGRGGSVELVAGQGVEWVW